MKKLLLSLVALLATVGAWAQSEPVLADGVYTIQADVDGRRGYLAATNEYDRPVLTGITWVNGNTDYTLNNASNVLGDSKNWYVSTKNGVTYLYNVAKGKFIYDGGIDEIYFGDPFALHLTKYKYNEKDYIHVGSGTGIRYLSMGCGAQAPYQVKWEKTTASDGGCLLTFTLVEGGTTTFATQVAAADKAIALAPLQKLIAVAKSYKAGTNIGDYTKASIDELAIAIAAAEAKVEADNVTDADVEALQDVIDALVINLPETGKYYRFISAATTQSRGTNVVMVANRTNAKVEWKAYGNDGNINAEIDNLWTFVDAGGGKYNLMAANGGYVGSVAGGSAQTALQTDVNNAGAYTLGFYTPGICKLFHGNAQAAHLWADGNNIICGWEAGAASNSAWYIVPGTNIDVVVNEYASIYLPFAVKVEGAQAYAIESTNATHAVLTEKTDIPAAQGAILAGNGTATLNIVAAASSDWTNNKLNGSTVNTYVDKEAYVLAKKDGVIGFYKAELNKKENGTDGETHFLNNANKAYLEVETANARFLSFDFGGNETAIESVKAVENNAIVYDLAGRRVKAAQKGLYIVNGKVVIK